VFSIVCEMHVLLMTRAMRMERFMRARAWSLARTRMERAHV
jgi:hypothetical protein